MKSRSEMIKERAEAEAAKKALASTSAPKVSKPSAAERTIPIPGTDVPANGASVDAVHCPDCNMDMRVADLKKREDGDVECNTCAMPLKVGSGAKHIDPMSTVKTDSKPASKVTTRTGAYCGQCGAEWPSLNGVTTVNCGHTSAQPVDDPRKAVRMQTVTASGMTTPPAGPVIEAPSISSAVLGNRLFMTWGKTTFPVGEALGVSKFSNMEIGPFNLSEDVKGSSVLETAARMTADLRKIADATFETQFVWYKQKLGLLDK